MSKGLGILKCALLYLAAALFVLSMNAKPLWAQAETASISGNASDPSGAALVGANVEAKNVATNSSQSSTTDAEGRYKIAQLSVGTYTVQASLTGFKTVVRSGIVLSVGSSVIVDFSLPVGQVSQTVNVEAEVSRVETTTSEISTLVSPQQMRELPLNGRNFTQLLTLAPGVTTIPNSVNLANFVVGRMYGAMDNYSVSGSRPTGQMFLLDGVDIRDFWEHSTGSGYGGTNLGVEAIGEFQVLTNTYNAQFAGNGVVMNAGTRYGTNDWHGGAYEFFRNSAFDARSLSDANAKLQTPSLPRTPPFRRNQFGGAFGGAIKKDKLFFFANYEGLRQGLATTLTNANFPMGYLRNGQAPCFTTGGTRVLGNGYTDGTNTCPGATPPLGTLPGAAGNPIVTVQPFGSPLNGGAGATALAISNVARAANILKLYALCKTCSPNTPPATGSAADLGGYYTGTEQSILNVNEDYILGRVDYSIGPNDSIFGRYIIDNAHVDDPRDPMGIFPETDHTRNQFAVITEKHIFSSTMINSVRFGYTRVKEQSGTPFHLSSAQLSAVGLCTDAPTCDPLNFVAANGYPDAAQRPDGVGTGSIGFAVAFPGLGPDADRPLNTIQSKFSGGDDLVWTHGRHSTKIGGVVQRVQTNNNQLSYSAGQSFLGWTAGANGGSTLQGFFEGHPNFGFEVVPQFFDSTRYFREIGMAPYVQDDWKVTSRLTLNLGIRLDYDTNPVGWSPEGPIHVVQGSFLAPIGPLATPPNCSGIDQSTSTVAVAQCRLGIYTPVRHVFANNPNAANWAPRVGFAYDPFSGHKTSIRGGFALFHDPIAARIYESGIVFTPPASSVTASNFFGPATADPCFPDPFAVVAGYCGMLNPSPGEFAAVDYRVPNGSPYTMQYNLSVQREIFHSTVLSIGYVGSVSRHMWMQRDENPPQCDTFPDCSATTAIPKALPTVGDPNFFVSPFCGFPVFGPCYGSGAHFAPGAPKLSSNFGPRVMEATTSSSSYNSIQVSLSRQFAHNLAGQVNYSWSHCIDDGSFATSLEFWGQLMTDAYNQRYDYGNCNFDVRHNLVANGLYSLPFKGNRLVEGWQFSTIVSINSGTPLNVTNNTTPGFDPSGLGAQWATRPNYSFAAGCGLNQMTKKWTTVAVPTSTGAIVNLREFQAFNAGCYQAQANGYVGNVKRNSVGSIGFINADISILKNTKITEKLNAQFRAEFFNIANHPNPGAPWQALGGLGPTLPTGNSAALATNPRQIQFALKLDF